MRLVRADISDCDTIWNMQIKAFAEVEKIHGYENWKLDTILQEAGNCHLYEKLGYKRTGVVENINEKMDIVYYENN